MLLDLFRTTHSKYTSHVLHRMLDVKHTQNTLDMRVRAWDSPFQPEGNLNEIF